MSQLVDSYKILEVNFGAQREDITSSYKRLCRIYHPDVSGDPTSEERMKQINLAYAFLCESLSAEERRRSRMATAPRTASNSRSSPIFASAREVMENYFKALMSEAYEKAYSLLSDYDRRYVTLDGFRDWRKSVELLFDMLGYKVTENDTRSTVTLKNGQKLPAKKCSISVSETNRVSGITRSEELIKIAVFERGAWRVFLGHRDIGALAQNFKDESMRMEMERVWRQWQVENCAEIGILSITGFLKQAQREVYAYNRHSRPFVLAVLSVKLSKVPVQKRTIMQKAAETVCATVRETDFVARAGDCELLILFSEMKKKYAGTITKRIAEAVEDDLREAFKMPVNVEFAFSAFGGGSLQEEIEIILNEICSEV